jgi:hypothetical protein
MKCQLHGIRNRTACHLSPSSRRLTSPDGDDVGPVDGGVVAHVGFDEFAGGVDVGDGE